MQVVVVGVIFPAEGMEKKMRLDLGSTVSAAKKEIFEKRQQTVPIGGLAKFLAVDDYGLFLPSTPSISTSMWMQDDMQLDAYDIEKRGVVEFRPKPQELTVLFENNSHTFEVDYLAPIQSIMPKIIAFFSFHNLDENAECGLQALVNAALLDPALSLFNQNVAFKANVTLINKNASKSKMKTLKAKQDKRVFGAPMEIVLEREGAAIVPIIQKSIDYIEKNALDVEGIFRLSGSASEIQSLKKSFDEGENPNLDKIKDPHVVCGLLKLYLRELPEPLLTFSFYPIFIAITEIKSVELQRKYYKTLIRELPKANQTALHKLFQFMTKIVAHSNHNKMAVHNVATVFAPNLLRSEGEALLIEDTAATNAIVCTLIQEGESLFQYQNQEYLGIARSLYDYQAQSGNQLSLQFGDFIWITYESSNGWWSGECNGKLGQFPFNYVESICKFRVEIKPGPSNPVTEPKIEEKQSGMTKSQFNDALEALKKQYEAEKQSRIELEGKAQQLNQVLCDLQYQVEHLRTTNQELQELIKELQ